MLYKETFRVWLWAFLRIPLLFFVRPRVVELGAERVVVKIPFGRRSRNHLGSMYFGALAIGADVAGGLIAMRTIEQSGGGVSLIFKDLHADFLKRAEGDVIFTCVDGDRIRELVALTRSSGEREEMPVSVVATVPSKLGEEPVAKFVLTLSLKEKSAP